MRFRLILKLYLLISIIFAFTTSVSSANNLDDSEYYQLKGNYCLEFQNNTWTLIFFLKADLMSCSYTAIAPCIEAFDYNDNYIWGKDDQGYFVYEFVEHLSFFNPERYYIDISYFDREPPGILTESTSENLHQIDYFSDESQWRLYLSDNVNIAEIQLHSPISFSLRHAGSLTELYETIPLSRGTVDCCVIHIAGSYYVFMQFDRMSGSGFVSAGWDLGFLLSSDVKVYSSYVGFIKQVTQYTYSGEYLFGKADKGYFVFKMASPFQAFRDRDTSEAIAKSAYNCIWFGTLGEFNNFLSSKLGITDYNFTDPEAEYAKLSDIEKYPIDYMFFHGFLWLPDNLLIILLVELISIAIGIRAFTKRSYIYARKIFWFAFPIGFVLTLIEMPKGDLGCSSIFLGLIMLPFIAISTSKLTYVLLKLYLRCKMRI